MLGPHIARDFDSAMASLRNELLSMASQTRLNLERAIGAVMTRNAELANAVIADDDEVDELERKIDQAGMTILIRYHPVASDLRVVLSSMKISTNLERISDHATNIAKRARKIAMNPELPDVSLIEPLYTLANQLLCDAITSYRDRDPSLGATLHDRDKELDQMHKKVIEIYSSRLESEKRRSEDYLHLIFIIRSLERVGDLSTNIGEDAVFLEMARDLRHVSDRTL
ncbi:MAG: phosphate signaling complex protein PhoU [Luteolibacter sp.]